MEQEGRWPQGTKLPPGGAHRKGTLNFNKCSCLLTNVSLSGRVIHNKLIFLDSKREDNISLVGSMFTGYICRFLSPFMDSTVLLQQSNSWS
jgi:hypothetical protein